MPIKDHRWANLSRVLIGGTVLPLLMAGCGTPPLAPESSTADPQARAFLMQVREQCGDLTLGQASIAWLLEGQHDPNFVNQTIKLQEGSLSKAEYTEAMSNFYPIDPGSDALACIYEQLPK